jgi:N-acetylmuramoyl-L-alanine amidase
LGDEALRPISEIIVHCSATRPEWMAGQAMADKVAEIRRWHIKDRGWKDIGYHYLIDRNGIVATGRPVEQVGAHVQGHNTGTIGVCLIGGHGSSETDRFDQHFTAQQDKALRALLADLKRKHTGVSKITGHNQYATKACPGFNVGAWYLKAKPVVDQPLASKPVDVSEPPVRDRQPPPAAYVAAFAAALAAVWQWGADVADWLIFWN